MGDGQIDYDEAWGLLNSDWSAWRNPAVQDVIAPLFKTIQGRWRKGRSNERMFVHFFLLHIIVTSILVYPSRLMCAGLDEVEMTGSELLWS